MTDALTLPVWPPASNVFFIVDAIVIWTIWLLVGGMTQ
jgi:hypothetical protein